MFLRSDRLFLRPFWPEDRAELAALAATDAGAVPGWRQPAASAVAEEPEDRRCPQFLVTLPGADGARIVGFAGLARLGETAELIVWIAPRWRGCGFGAEAVKSLLPLARALGHRRLNAAVPAGRADMARFFRQLGFACAEPAGGRDGPARAQPLADTTFAVELGAFHASDDGNGKRSPRMVA